MAHWPNPDVGWRRPAWSEPLGRFCLTRRNRNRRCRCRCWRRHRRQQKTISRSRIFGLTASPYSTASSTAISHRYTRRYALAPLVPLLVVGGIVSQIAYKNWNTIQPWLFEQGVIDPPPQSIATLVCRPTRASVPNCPEVALNARPGLRPGFRSAFNSGNLAACPARGFIAQNDLAEN